jgi:hypothetical protein
MLQPTGLIVHGVQQVEAKQTPVAMLVITRSVASAWSVAG